jgi:hypothetical protein
MSLVNPLILAELGIESTLLERAQFEGKLWPKFLQTDLFGVAEDVAMVPEEDKITLVVERDAVAAFVLRIVWEERGERASHLKAQTCVEVVQEDLWLVFCKSTTILTHFNLHFNLIFISF